jgi:hypothetical protein
MPPAKPQPKKCDCGAYPTDYAKTVPTPGPCLYGGCDKGYKKCEKCIWAGKTILKCCGASECGGTGKRACKNCKGTDIVTTSMACTKQHKTPDLRGRS